MRSNGNNGKYLVALKSYHADSFSKVRYADTMNEARKIAMGMNPRNSYRSEIYDNRAKKRLGWVFMSIIDTGVYNHSGEMIVRDTGRYCYEMSVKTRGGNRRVYYINKDGSLGPSWA